MSTELQEKNGIRNCLLILIGILLTRDLAYEFSFFNTLNVLRLLRVKNIGMILLLFGMVIARSVVLYFYRSLLLLAATEIFFYIFIFRELKGIVTIYIAIFTITNMMKLYSFLVESENIVYLKEEKPKVVETPKIEQPVFPSDISTSELNEEPITFLYYIKYLISPALIFLTKYPEKKRSIFGALKAFFCMTLVFVLTCLFSGFFLIPASLDFVYEISLYGLVQYLKIAYMTFIFWIFTFLFTFKYSSDLLAEITNISVITHKDWWNCNSFSEFWRKWNVQTHIWLKKYIFLYFINIDRSSIAYFSTFLISAIIHEMVSSFLLKRANGAAFMSILSQYFIILLESNVKIMNNATFWILFSFIGQPVVFLYSRDYIKACIS